MPGSDRRRGASFNDIPTCGIPQAIRVLPGNADGRRRPCARETAVVTACGSWRDLVPGLPPTPPATLEDNGAADRSSRTHERFLTGDRPGPAPSARHAARSPPASDRTGHPPPTSPQPSDQAPDLSPHVDTSRRGAPRWRLPRPALPGGSAAPLLQQPLRNSRRGPLDGDHRLLDLDVAPFLLVPRGTHAAQSRPLMVENGCRDPVDAGGELAHGHEVPVPLDLAQACTEGAPGAAQPGVLDLLALPGIDGFQAVMGQMGQDHLGDGPL